jgi:DNA gyrase subunit A
VRTIPHGKTDGYLVMATTKGTVKRTALEQFKNVRRNGLRAITLDEEDELAWVLWASGSEDIMLVTARGMGIRFKQDQIRAMGREAAGVRGIRLRKGDSVIRMDLVGNKNNDLLVVTEHGFGKRTPLAEFRVIGRGGMGVTAAKLTAKTGDLVAARVVGDGDAEAIMMSAEGLVTRTDVKSIRETGRAAQGVIVMRLNKGDTVTSMATLSAAEELQTD